MVIIIGIFVIVPINRIHVKNVKIPSKSHNSTIWSVDKPMKNQGRISEKSIWMCFFYYVRKRFLR